MTEQIDPKRSALMARVKGRDTRPEIRVRRLAHELGARFRLQRRDLPGTPDLVFPSRRLALFVHGCFWHRHPGCRHATDPRTRVAFWQSKFAANVERDRRVGRALEDLGWRVEVVWECETRKREVLEPVLKAILGLDTVVDTSDSDEHSI
ncbi:DNA mismatch endonuclease (patch repair protein) [Caulobacter rhizosphaerae]|uniref:Very short patch repair endonuclease n=1 Tax=Caulobacter rhizosphaerae TaxID=2010972 RepID=A0ABU1MVP3_9CAUL|nr:DNA mismatch endonuclease Vsr [Caulobacter rhizosphaerae]MDR6530259.1 DNA mismatch endonuclease (patch repair protein) [Caulobacter rhizosphaerae]